MFSRALILSLVVFSVCVDVAMAHDEPDAATKQYLGWKPLAEGDVGKLSFPYRVIQIVDDNNAIVEIMYYPWVTYADAKTETVWIKMSTKGMADDKKYTTTEYFKVVGTKKYETAIGGSKTVMMIETSEDPNIAKATAAQTKVAEQKAAAIATRRAEHDRRVQEDTRTWTSASSSRTMIATFSGRIGDKVKLKREDGTIIALTWIS